MLLGEHLSGSSPKIYTTMFKKSQFNLFSSFVLFTTHQNITATTDKILDSNEQKANASDSPPARLIHISGSLIFTLLHIFAKLKCVLIPYKPNPCSHLDFLFDHLVLHIKQHHLCPLFLRIHLNGMHVKPISLEEYLWSCLYLCLYCSSTAVFTE